MVDLTNAIAGAGTGATVGSLFGPVGTGLGAAAGGLVGLFGKKKKKKKFSTFDPQQQQLYNQFTQAIQGGGPLADLYNWNAEGYNDVFDQNYSRPAYRNFQENIVPEITGSFRRGNLQNSSYLGEALSRAGRNVQESLDAQRSANQFQGYQQANRDRQSALDRALTMQTQVYQDRSNPIDDILQAAAPRAADWFFDMVKQRNSAGA